MKCIPVAHFFLNVVARTTPFLSLLAVQPMLVMCLRILRSHKSGDPLREHGGFGTLAIFQ
jgi:hypothetical protein